MSFTWTAMLQEPGFGGDFASSMIAQLEEAKEAYLLELFGSREGALLCAPYWELVEEPLDFTHTADGGIRVTQRIRIERIKPVPLVP